MMTDKQTPGCTIVVTRPVEQAKKLIESLQDAGISAVHFPVIAISPGSDQQQLLAQAEKLASYDMAIFISRNAADYGSALVKKALGTGNWPEQTRIAAIGRGTARQLQQHGLATDILANGPASSETLLAETEMQQVAGKHILILRGNGGREKLAETLRQRGAVVDYLECYKRERPHIKPDILSDLWLKNSLDGIVLTSAEGLQNLYQMVRNEDLPRLNHTPLFVISSTMVELCGKLGYKLRPILMPSATDEDVIEAVTAFCRNNKVADN